MTALGVGLVSWLVVRQVSDSAQQRFEQHARAELQQLAASAAALVDVEAHAAFAADDSRDDETMSLLVAPLGALARAQSGIERLYSFDRNGDSWRLVLDSKGGSGAATPGIQPEALDALTRQVACVSAVHETPEGRRVSAYAPLRRQSGATTGVMAVDALDTILDDPTQTAEHLRTYGAVLSGLLALGVALAVYLMRIALRDTIAMHDARLAVLEHKAVDVTRAQEKAGSVLATMSHELRTPLTAILGFTELLLDPSDDVAVLRSHAQTIRRNSQHLLGVLNDVLDISKIDSGTMRIDRSPCDPIRLAQDVIELLGPRAVEKRLTLEHVRVGAVPPFVDADAFRVRQILLNLVNNALKFTAEGRVKLTTRYDARAGCLEYLVADTGVGIEPAEFAHIFLPFSQARDDAARHHSGTGLGLAISKRLAVRMEGDLTVSSRVGLGSTFTLRIPAQVSDVRESDAGSELEQHGETWTPRPSWRVLVVEDTLEHQKIFYACLRRAGHSVDVCDNGERALHRVRESEYLGEPYTVVLMDVYLPGANGIATSRAMREYGYRGPILAVTADTSPETREQCLAAGCDDVSAKPIDRAALLSVMTRLVRRAASLGAA